MHCPWNLRILIYLHYENIAVHVLNCSIEVIRWVNCKGVLSKEANSSNRQSVIYISIRFLKYSNRPVSQSLWIKRYCYCIWRAIAQSQTFQMRVIWRHGFTPLYISTLTYLSHKAIRAWLDSRQSKIFAFSSNIDITILICIEDCVDCVITYTGNIIVGYILNAALRQTIDLVQA